VEKQQTIKALPLQWSVMQNLHYILNDWLTLYISPTVTSRLFLNMPQSDYIEYSSSVQFLLETCFHIHFHQDSLFPASYMLLYLRNHAHHSEPHRRWTARCVVSTVYKLLVRQVLNKSKLWSRRVTVGRCVINMCTQPWRIRVASIVLWEAVSRAPSVERRVSAAPVSRAPQLIITNYLG